MKICTTAFVACAFLTPAFAFDSAKILIPSGAGGGFDQTGRALGAGLVDAKATGKVSYENKPGAGGVIGLVQFVNTEKANPSALLVTGSNMIGAIETNKPPITLKNATPIARLVADGMMIVVPANSPIKSIKEVTEKLKTSPGAVTIGGGQKGSIDHILAGLLAKESGADPKKINYVPFAGGGEASAAILGGHVTIGIAGVSEFMPHVQNGKMRALAVTTGEIPGVPTLKSSGLNIDLTIWRGVYGAPNLSAAERDALSAAVVKATQTDAWKQAVTRNDWTSAILTGPEFINFVEAEHTRLGTALRDLGVAK